MKRPALATGFRLGGVGVGAAASALAFAGTGAGTGDALTSGEMESLGRDGAVAMVADGAAVIDADALGGGAEDCGFGATVPLRPR